MTEKLHWYKKYIYNQIMLLVQKANVTAIEVSELIKTSIFRHHMLKSFYKKQNGKFFQIY